MGRAGDPRLRPLRPGHRPCLPSGGRARVHLGRGQGRAVPGRDQRSRASQTGTFVVKSALSLTAPPQEEALNPQATTERITLADVAARAGVSLMTVSRVVNDRPGVGEGTRERVREAIESLGYRPNIVARGLKAASSKTIGLMVPDVTNPYFPEIVRGAEDGAGEHGYTLLLTNVIEDTRRETRALQTFEDHLVDGVIACSPRLDNNDLYPLLQRQRAAVLINRRSDPRYAGSVRIDHELGARLLLRHLHQVGCRRPAFLSGPGHSHAGRERMLGLDREARELEIELPRSRVLACPPTVEGGATAAREIVTREPHIDALLCFNDLVAAGAL